MPPVEFLVPGSKFLVPGSCAMCGGLNLELGTENRELAKRRWRLADGFRSRRDATDQTVCWLRFARTLAGPARDGSLRPGSPGIASRDVSVLLRKEVIQPQVPLRLPCYDFIPITTHTLGGSVPCGFGHRLRVQTAFMM